MNILFSIFDSIKWLTGLEMTLCLLNLIVLIWHFIPNKKHFRGVDFVPGVGIIISIISIISGDTSIAALALYLLTVVVFLCTAKNLFKPVKNIASKRFKVIRAIFCVCGMIPIVLILMLAGELRYNPESDLSKISYPKAFIALNQRMAVEYPFGDWKKVNWNELLDKYVPIMEQAEKDKNKTLYYKALREYLYSFRDSHIKIDNDSLFTENKIFKDEAGGGFGISTIRLDDGRVLVNMVLDGSPADKSGMKSGAEILIWDGIDVKKAYKNTFWSDLPMTTKGDHNYNQGRFMVRAPIGKQIQIEFRNPGDIDIKKVSLTAYDDNYGTLKKTRIKLKESDPPIEGEILGNGYGYIKIRYFLSNKDIKEPAAVLEEKLKEFQTANVKGVIIDLRDNPGGDDEMAVKMAGHFVDEEKFYEYASYYNRNTCKFEINYGEAYTIKPLEPIYKGKVAILVNNRTSSSGEGLPLALKGLPNVKIVGFTSTNGSFGVVTSPITIKMPEGYMLQIPDGRSLNKEKVIQGDCDYTGQGGVDPDIKIPLNEETFNKKYIDGQDIEIDYAIEALK